MPTQQLMLETSAIGQLEEEGVDLQLLRESDAEYFATHVQEDELRQIGDEEFRREMMDVLETIRDEDLPTDSFVWGVSRWGRAKFGGSQPMTTIRDELSEDGGNEVRDALIAGTAVSEGLVLVTHDRELHDVVQEHYPDRVWSVDEFLTWLRP